MNAAVFLDRDGTLIEEREYLADPDRVTLLPGVVNGLQRLRSAGYQLLIVTNQSGIGRGYYTETDMHRVNRRLCELLARDGIEFLEIYFAPEAPEQPSRGRKPSPQFLFDARDRFGLDLGASYMIGDKAIDVECGWNAGVRASVLVRTGYGRQAEVALASAPKPWHACDDLATAADWILARREPATPRHESDKENESEP